MCNVRTKIYSAENHGGIFYTSNKQEAGHQLNELWLSLMLGLVKAYYDDTPN